MINSELLAALASGTVRKTSSGWICTFPAATAKAPLTLANDIVVALLSSGRLVPHCRGGYQLKVPEKPASQRFSAHRPERFEGGAAPTINDAESPLTWLRSRKDKSGKAWISEHQFLAGERLRMDYERGQMGARVTANWDPTATAGRTSGNAAAHVSDAVIIARQSLFAALEAVGPELSAILVQVCCLSAGLEQAERQLEMPQRSGKTVLNLALTRLARHYGLVRGEAAPRRTPLAQWGLPGYRPDFPAQAPSASEA